jgi:dTDP-L-oleandrosyltransferase
MTYHVVMLNNSGYGHVLPTLDVVAELVRRGHQVTYVTAEGPVRKVAATGATVVEYRSRLPEVDLATMNTRDGLARLPMTYFQESLGLLRAVEEHLGDVRPDLVAYDVTVYHAGRILSRKWGVPGAQMLPVFASNEHFSLFDKMFDEADRNLRHPAIGEFFRALVRLLAEHGQSDTPIEEFIGRVEGLNIGFLPRSFQYAGDSFDDRFVFVGPAIDDFDDGEWTPPGDGRPVLLVSLGTSVNRRPGFFETCLRTFAEMPWHVVMAVHEGVDLGVAGGLPPNVEVHPWVPFFAVLRHADAFVSHGGFGSLMGSLHCGTPIVVVPDSPEARVNAQRIAELGLGRVIRDRPVTPERLRGAVLDVAADSMTRKRVEDMRRDIAQAGGGPLGADAIEAYLSKHTPAVAPCRARTGG